MTDVAVAHSSRERRKILSETPNALLFDDIICSTTHVSQRAKLVAQIRRNPRDIRIEDALKVADWLGFKGAGGKGRHDARVRPGEPIGLNFQEKNGKIPIYQAKQLILMIEKYGREILVSEDDND